MNDPWAEYRIPTLGERKKPKSLADEVYDDIAETALKTDELKRQREVAAAAAKANNPERAAKARRLAESQGVPVEAVEANMDGYEQIDRMAKAAAAAKGDPRVSGWLGSNADIASDDLLGIATLRDNVDIFKTYSSSRYGIEKGKGPSVAPTAKELAGLAEFNRKADVQDAMSRGVLGQVAGSIRAGTATAAAGLSGTAAAVAGVVGAGKAEDKLLEVSATIRQYADDNRGKSTSFVADSAYQGIESVPLSLIAVATGSMGAGLALFGTTVGGGEYVTARESGLGVEKSLAYGTLQGMIEVAFEKAPMDELFKIAGGAGVTKAIKRYVVKEVLGEQATTALQDLNQWATLNPDKPFSAYLAERPEAAARTFIGTLSGSAPQVAVSLGLRKAIGEQTRIENSNVELSALDAIMEGAAASKVRGRDPLAFKALIDKLAGQNENILIPASVIASYNQDYRNDEFWQDYAADIDEGLASGGEISIPLSVAAARLAGTPAWEAIKNDVRTSPNGATRTEVDEANAELDDIRFEAEDAIEQEDRAARQKAVPGERLRQSVRDRLMNTGMTPEMASANAELVAALYETRAANQGIEVTGREFDPVSVLRVLPELIKTQPADTLDMVINAMRQGKDAVEGVGPSLLQFIKKRGGINDSGGDLKSMGLDKRLIRDFNPDQGALGGVSGAGDYGIDSTLRAAIQEGFFPALADIENQAGPSDLDTQILLDAIEQEIGGQKVFAETREDTMRAAAEELRQLLSSSGMDPETATDAEIKAMLESDGRLLDQGELEDGPVSRFTLLDEGLNKSVAAQALVNSSGLSAQELSDIVEGIALLPEPDRLVGVPSLAPMLSVVRSAIAVKMEVADIIVELVPVDVVNNLFGSKAAANVALHDEAMLENAPAFDAELTIAVGADRSSSVRLLMLEIARVAAKEVLAALPLNATGKSGEGRATFVANQADGFGQPNASIEFLDSGAAIIKLFEGANASSFSHEMAHYWLEQFKADAAVSTNERTLADWKALTAYFEANGHEVGETISEGAHELWARSWERYLMEGKSPSTRLNSVFRKFAAWMKAVYRAVKNLNAPITPEIREVMDRMLATEEEIALKREEQQAVLMFDDAMAAGMAEAEAKRYAELADDARASAEEELLGRVMRSIRARETKEWQEQEKVVRQSVTDSVEARPMFRALAMLREKEGPRLDKEWLEETYGKDSLKLLPGGMPLYAKRGANADMLAEMAGYRSGDEMVRALIGLEQTRRAMKEGGDKRSVKSATIDFEVAQEMHERFGDPLNDGTIEREALAAVQNELNGERLAMELSALGKKVGKAPTPYRLAREWAREKIARGVVAETISGAAQQRYARTAAKASREAQQAFVKGDNLAAFRAKQTEMLHNALAREAADASDRVDVMVRRLGKYAKQRKATTLPLDYLDRIHAILEGFEFKQRSQRSINRQDSLREWIAEQEDQGRTVDVPKHLLEAIAVKNWSRLTVDELSVLNDTVMQIAAIGRMKDKLLTAKKDREIEAAASEMESAIVASKKAPIKDNRTRSTLAYRAASAFKSFKAMHRKMASLARQMDSVKDGGPVWENIIRPMMGGFDMEAQDTTIAANRLMEILGPFYGRNKFGIPKMGGKGIYFPTMDRSFNLEERMAIVGQMGNAGNMQRLIDGERGEFGIRWTLVDLALIRDSLTKEQMDAVQAIWDMFESYRPRIAEKERRVNGVEPKWIDPVPLETRHGTYRGGYWPVKYDPERTLAAQQGDDAAEADRQMRGSFTSATTRRSFTKDRADKVVGRPLLYSMSSATQGLTEVLHDLAFHEYLIDTNRLLRHPKVSGAIINYYGPEVLEQFRRGIEDVAAGSVGAQNIFERGVNHIRMGATVAGLGWNLKTALLQPFGITQSIVRVGAPWIARGMAAWVSSPLQTQAEIWSKSTFMRERSRTMQREINEIRNRIQGGTKTGEFINASFFILITRTQLAVDIPTWKGAYEKAIAANNDDDRAVALANQAVRDAQGGGQIGDLAAIQRGSPLLKLFTNFYSFFNTTHNLAAESFARTDFKKPGDMMALTLDYLLLYSLPAAMGYFLQKALAGDDDDEETMLEGLAAEHISFLMATMVGVRELSGAAQSFAGALTGTDLRPYEMAYGGPAGLRALQEAEKLSRQAAQGELDRALRKSAVNTTGILFHLPSGQINRTWDGADALAEGETDNPMALVIGAPQ